MVGNGYDRQLIRISLRVGDSWSTLVVSVEIGFGGLSSGVQRKGDPNELSSLERAAGKIGLIA